MAVLPPLIIMVESRIVLRVVGYARHQIFKRKEGLNVQILRAVLIYFFKDFPKPLLRVKNGRLVHVVPEAVNSLIQQDFVLSPKPPPGLLV